MRIKSYFVKTVDDAIVQARAELGDDALLLNIREAAAGLEVAFGSGGQAEAQPEPAPRDLDVVRGQLDEIRRILASEQNRQRLPELARIFENLVGNGIDAALAGEIVEGIDAAMTARLSGKTPRFTWGHFEKILRTELSARIATDSSLGNAGAMVLVGPGGAGKTATLTKIAAFQAASRRPVRILTLDTALASRMQLQFFARKAGVPFTAVENPETLPALLENRPASELALIDTPTCSDPGERAAIAAILSRCSALDIHLVLAGYMTAAALRQAIAKYDIFHAAKLIVTRLDESPSFGAAIAAAAHAGLALSLVTDGVSPKNLKIFSLEDVVAMALGAQQSEAACA